MPSTHVWLLDRGGPETEARVRPWLESVARDPSHSTLPGFLLFVWAWIWSHWAARRVLPLCRQIGGPAPQLSDAREQARLLRGLLGQRYAVHPVFRNGGEDARDARAALSPGDQVVLVPLHPQRHPVASRAALETAQKTLSGRPNPVTAIEAWGLEAGLLDLMARRIRAVLIELREHGPTGVVFAAVAPPRPGRPAADTYLAELAETATRLTQRLRFGGPVLQAWIPSIANPKAPEPTLPTAANLCAQRGARSVIVVPIGCTTSWPELRACTAGALEDETPIESVRVLLPLAPSIDLGRLLATLVRRSERAAGWTLPEDTVRHEIESELRAAGHQLVSGESP